MLVNIWNCRWCKRLTDAIDAFKMSDAVRMNIQRSESAPVSDTVQCKNTESSDVISHVQE